MMNQNHEAVSPQWRPEADSPSWKPFGEPSRHTHHSPPQHHHTPVHTAYLHPSSSFESTISPQPSPMMVHSAPPPPPPMHHAHHHAHLHPPPAHPHLRHPPGYESHSMTNPAVPYYVPSMPHYPYYPWPPLAAPHHHHHHPPPVELIAELQPNDVLSGRGGATNSYKGNRAFRVLVKQYQQKYLTAKKRDKPAVATEIVAVIRKRSGRFLRRWNESPTSSNGMVMWVDIGDDRAREKTCQALREGAPEMRKRFRGGDQKPEVQEDETTADEKPPATTPPESPNKKPTLEGPILLRPCNRLMPKRDPVEPMELDQLPADDREMYLRDFFPPSDVRLSEDHETEDRARWQLVAAS